MPLQPLPAILPPAFIAGYLDAMAYRADQRGQGVACGRSWISRAKKCSKTKAAATPEDAKRRTVEKSKERTALRGQVERSKGQKARVKQRERWGAPGEIDRAFEGMKAFAQDPLNRDILSLSSQGLSDRQMSSNLQVGRGTVVARIAAANEILGNGRDPSGTLLRETMKAFRSKRLEGKESRSPQPTIESTRQQLTQQRNRDIQAQVKQNPALAKVVEHYRGPKTSDRKFLQSSGLSREEAQRAFVEVRQLLNLGPGDDPRKAVRDIFGSKRRKDSTRLDFAIAPAFDVVVELRGRSLALKFAAAPSPDLLDEINALHQQISAYAKQPEVVTSPMGDRVLMSPPPMYGPGDRVFMVKISANYDPAKTAEAIAQDLTRRYRLTVDRRIEKAEDAKPPKSVKKFDSDPWQTGYQAGLDYRADRNPRRDPLGRFAEKAGTVAGAIAKPTAAWAVGKTVGGAIAQAAASHGIDPGVATQLSESVVQAMVTVGTRTLERGSGKPQQIIKDLVIETAAVFAGKNAYTIDDSILGGDDLVQDAMALAIAHRGNLTQLARNFPATKTISNLFKKQGTRMDSLDNLTRQEQDALLQVAIAGYVLSAQQGDRRDAFWAGYQAGMAV